MWILIFSACLASRFLVVAALWILRRRLHPAVLWPLLAAYLISAAWYVTLLKLGTDGAAPRIWPVLNILVLPLVSSIVTCVAAFFALALYWENPPWRRRKP